VASRNLQNKDCSVRNLFLLCLACLLGTTLGVHETAATTGKELYQSCLAGDKSAETEFCSAYVHGFIDGMIMGYTAHGTVRGYCPPVSGVSAAQGRAIIETWLHDHPERLDTDAGILAGLALSEAFPCKSEPH
jgi:hypothetical protein